MFYRTNWEIRRTLNAYRVNGGEWWVVEVGSVKPSQKKDSLGVQDGVILDVGIDLCLAIEMRDRSLAVGQVGGSGQGAPEVGLESGRLGSGASHVDAPVVLDLHGLFRPDPGDKGLVKVSHRVDGVCTGEGIVQAGFVVMVGYHHFDAALDEGLGLCAARVAGDASDLPAGVGGQGIDDACALHAGCAGNNNRLGHGEVLFLKRRLKDELDEISGYCRPGRRLTLMLRNEDCLMYHKCEWEYVSSKRCESAQPFISRRGGDIFVAVM